MKKSYDSKFKSRVALEAIQGMNSIAKIASDHNIHPNMVGQWKRKLLDEFAEVFATKAEKKQENKYSEGDLIRKIGQLEVENDFLRKKAQQPPLETRKTQIEKTHPKLSVNRQLELLDVPKSSYYYRQRRKV